MRYLRKGISPVIATVIIVAVAIAIAVAVVGWVMGVWSSVASGSPAVSIPAAEIDTNGNLNLYVKNEGSGSDKILKIEVEYNNNVYTCTNISKTTIEANYAGWISASCSISAANAGDKALVRVYLEKSGTISIPVVFKPGQKSSK